jgi:hypothetical protein
VSLKYSELFIEDNVHKQVKFAQPLSKVLFEIAIPPLSASFCFKRQRSFTHVKIFTPTFSWREDADVVVVGFAAADDDDDDDANGSSG